jgi:hypothetical protein
MENELLDFKFEMEYRERVRKIADDMVFGSKRYGVNRFYGPSYFDSIQNNLNESMRMERERREAAYILSINKLP